MGFKKGAGDGAEMADHDQSKGGEELLHGMKSGCQMGNFAGGKVRVACQN